MAIVHSRGPRPMAEALNQATPLTRQQRRLLDTLVEMARSVTVVELAEALESHPNTIREHLAVLEESGLVSAATVPSKGRGRPRKVYRTNAGARGAPARHLVGLITAALKAFPDDTAQADGYRWGRTWGEDIAASGVYDGSDGAVEGVTSLMADMGFAPQMIDSNQGCMGLTQCPLLSTGQAVPKGLCEIHQGMLDEVLNREAPDAKAFVEPFAEPNACRLTVNP